MEELCWAENFGEIMCGARRRAALERVSNLLDTELQRMYSEGRADAQICSTRQITTNENETQGGSREQIRAHYIRRCRRQTFTFRIDFQELKTFTLNVLPQQKCDVGKIRKLTLVEFIEYLYYKINDAINSLDGGQRRGYHRLVRFQQKTKDKAPTAKSKENAGLR
ncbi:hypothetical protein DICVIV_08753 [Dictyocaulus viviparus]|uniref:Uncharacterized protein n=1 Tax=Dictyocaulus viviparus TaxID=29172 RepID=A0A0D8XNA8_DICVI|nr:hypothetical protein DICVIV_08753 [Dictyocaulus viviparus]